MVTGCLRLGRLFGFLLLHNHKQVLERLLIKWSFENPQLTNWLPCLLSSPRLSVSREMNQQHVLSPAPAGDYRRWCPNAGRTYDGGIRAAVGPYYFSIYTPYPSYWLFY